MRGLLYFALCLLGHLAPAASSTLEIIDFGLVVRGAAVTRPMDGKVGETGAPRPIPHLERMQHIEANLCLEFGMTVKLVVEAAELPPHLDVKLVHPTMIKPDGSASTEIRTLWLAQPLMHIGFRFDERWELVVGLWTFIVSIDQHEAARQDFVIEAPISEEIKNDCK